jgi:hypothetical protein
LPIGFIGKYILSLCTTIHNGNTEESKKQPVFHIEKFVQFKPRQSPWPFLMIESASNHYLRFGAPL